MQQVNSKYQGIFTIVGLVCPVEAIVAGYRTISGTAPLCVLFANVPELR